MVGVYRPAGIGGRGSSGLAGVVKNTTGGNGDGHTGYHDGNSCVDNTVNAYLVSGTVPTKKEISC